MIDIGIRSLDLGFALLDNYDVTILVDTVSRGGAPGTLYTIEIAPDDMPESHDETAMVNSHGLDVVRVLALEDEDGRAGVAVGEQLHVAAQTVTVPIVIIAAHESRRAGLRCDGAPDRFHLTFGRIRYVLATAERERYCRLLGDRISYRHASARGLY